MLLFLSSQSLAVGQPESPPKSNPMNGLMNPCASALSGAATTNRNTTSDNDRMNDRSRLMPTSKDTNGWMDVERRRRNAASIHSEFDARTHRRGEWPPDRRTEPRPVERYRLQERAGRCGGALFGAERERQILGVEQIEEIGVDPD